MITQKVFDKYDLPDECQEALHKLASECWGGGNPTYVPWTVGDDEPGLGWITKEQEAAIEAAIKEDGAKDGDAVLIMNWW